MTFFVVSFISFTHGKPSKFDAYNEAIKHPDPQYRFRVGRHCRIFPLLCGLQIRRLRAVGTAFTHIPPSSVFGIALNGFNRCLQNLLRKLLWLILSIFFFFLFAITCGLIIVNPSCESIELTDDGFSTLSKPKRLFLIYPALSFYVYLCDELHFRGEYPSQLLTATIHYTEWSDVFPFPEKALINSKIRFPLIMSLTGAVYC